MKVGIVKVVYDRKTGNRLNEKLIDTIEVEEDKYYSPIVKMLGDSFLTKQQQSING